MTKIKNIEELKVDTFKTFCSYTGTEIDDSLEQKLIPIKIKLVQKALDKYKIISMCSNTCFQIFDKKLLFWFNNKEESTKITIEVINNF